VIEPKEPSASNNLLKISIVILLVLLVSTSLLVVAYVNIQHKLEAIEANLADQELQLEDLRNQINIFVAINETGLLPWPQIYNQMKHSVVLVETDSGLGSGFVYDKAGRIITNYHVVEDATSIQVTFLDGNITEASIIGEDPYSDLAVISIAPITDLHPVVIGESLKLVVGEPVAAMGNPFGLSDTMTVGIVSALDRTLEAPGRYTIIDVIQLDAAINPGNSGGPLVNLAGQVIGINTAITSESGDFSGVGFAIASDSITREIDDLISYGSYKHPWIGISGLDIDIAIAQYIGLEKAQGVLLWEVVQGSPADIAGLQGGDTSINLSGREILVGGDIVVGVDNQTIRKINDLIVYVERNKSPGDKIDITIIRDGQEITTELTLGERPPPE